jgi:signal transduction histidine kinase/ActR/RegA family two-component response regulator
VDGLQGRPLADFVPQLELEPAPAGAPSPPIRQPQEQPGRTGECRPLQLHVSASEIGTADARQFVVIINDVTAREQAEAARRELQAQLQQAQKIESIGTLANGIAHDFNNVLAAIVGQVELAAQAIERGAPDEAQRMLLLVRRAADRARGLVRQILTFSRPQSAQRSVQALQPLVEDALNMLRSTLPAEVSLQARLDPAPVAVRVDGIQVEQVVLNLGTNAWQALGGRAGRLEVGVERVELSDAAAGRLGLQAGGFARLWVADDGVGMDEATRQRVFEPFFTTKPAGSGTGLGLAVVHGIVRSHEGAIDVTSTPGQGSRFDLYLPLAPVPLPDTLADESAAAAVRGNGERVLYLDDDGIMPMMVEALLQRSGYVVQCFADPAAALASLRSRPDDFDVIVTDYNMPGLSGLDVIRAVHRIRPDMPTVLTSGFVSDDLRAQARSLGVGAVLEKQNTLDGLASAIQHATVARSQAAPAG